MGFRIARSHARKLRWVAHLTLFVVPLVLSVAGTLASPSAAVAAALVAAVSGGLGVLVERWLFFAEARHASMLYYGR
jgi:DMSO reductase anchor subunit